MPLTQQQIAEMDAVLANRGGIKTPAGMIPFDGIPAVDMDSFGDMSGGMERPPAAPSSLTPDLMAKMDAALAESGKAPKKEGVLVGDVNDTLIPREWRAASYGISGGQIPFGNVLTSGIGAGIAKAASPFTGDERTYGELYNQAQADTKAVQDESPWATGAGNVLGALTTLPAAFSKGGVSNTKLGQALTTGAEKATEYAGKMAGFSPFADKGLGAAGNVLTRYAGRSALAAPVTGAYFAGEADAGNRGEAFRTGALVGASASAALPMAGAVLGKVINKTVTPSSKMIGEASSALFKSGLAKGAKFSGEAADELVKTAGSLRTVDPYAKAATGADEMDAITKKLIAAKKHPMTLDSYEVLDKAWGSLGHQASIAGKHDLARKYDILQSKLRDIATNDKFVVGSTKDGIGDYQKAVKLWAIRSKLRDIEQIEEFAKYYVGGEASGIKAGYARLAKSNKIYKFSPQEVKMITKAAQTGNTEGLLRTLGSRLMVIGGAIKGGPVGAAAAYAASQAARGGASVLKGIESGRIGKSIANQAVEIAPNLAKKPAMPPTLSQQIANALGVSRAGIKGNPKAAQFLKDYIADESGALTIGGKKFYRGVSGDFPDKEFTFWTPSKKEAESYASGSALTNNGTNKVILERIFEGGKGKNIDEEILETIMDGFEYNGKIIDDPDEVAKIIMDREGLDWVEFMHPSADGGEDHIVRVVRKK